MNEIEQKFYDAWEAWSEEYDEDDIKSDPSHCPHQMLQVQPIIGIYKPDFMIGSCLVEIDGHEYHKTKEQRFADYQRERFFLKQVVYEQSKGLHRCIGYTIIRFMASEVYVDAKKCVLEMLEIANRKEELDILIDEVDWRRKSEAK